MPFTKHLKERAARKLIASRCCVGWLAWAYTLLLVSSTMIISVLGLFTSPLVLGCATVLLVAPAACRAKSVVEPMWHPATVILPTRASLLGLDPEPQSVTRFYTFSLLVRVGSAVLCFLIFSWTLAAAFIQYDKLEAQDCCHEASLNVYEKEDMYQKYFYLSCQRSSVKMTRYSLATFDADGCLEQVSMAACLEKLALAYACRGNTSEVSETVRVGCSAVVPEYLRCQFHGGLHAISGYEICLSLPQWLFSTWCGSIVRFRRINSMSGIQYLVLFGVILAVFLAPFLAAVCALIMVGCFSIPQSDVDLRLAVDAEVRDLQEELDSQGTSTMSNLGRALLRLDLILVFMDFAGDMLSVWTFASTHHPWFGVFQALIILRSVPAIWRLQLEEGIVNEVRLSLEANTLTDSLYDLLLQEKTVEGTLTTLLMTYVVTFTIDSPFAFNLSLAKWALSLRSLTNGCFIHFHLAQGDAKTDAFLVRLPLGKTTKDTE